MSVYQNQTNVSPGTSYFALAGSGGGSASDWSLYPAISTITYSGAGGLAYFSGLVVEEGMNVPIIEVSTITATGISATTLGTLNLNVSSINSAFYPPAAPIVGTTPVPEGCNSFVTATIPGITANSVIIGTLTASSACQITTLTPGSNYFTIDLVPPSPAATRFNYAIYPAAT